MVYCDQDMCESKLGRLMQAFRADRPSEWQMDEFICMAEQMNKEIELLRQAEKDAARYRWLRDNSVDLDWVVYGEEKTHVDITVWHNDGFDSANNGVDATPEEIDALIDEAMQCSK